METGYLQSPMLDCRARYDVFFRKVLWERPLYKKALWSSSVLFLILFICVTPSSYGWVPSDWNAAISTWASLFASLFAGTLVIAFVEAINLEKELGSMKELLPFINHLIESPDRKLKITVAAMTVLSNTGHKKAPGSGEAMAISNIVRLFTELRMSKAQIDLSYAEDNGEKDWKIFQETPIDRMVLGGPKYCEVTKVFLREKTALQFEKVDDDQWKIVFQREEFRNDVNEGIDYGLILWYKEDDHWWIFLAGCGTHGVIAAGEAITTKKHVEKILREAKDPEKANDDFSNLAVLVRCTSRTLFVVKDLEVKKVFRFA